MSYEMILLEHDGPIARLTLNTPEKRNAMVTEMGQEIERAVAEINQSDARVVVIRGAGHAFSAGGSLKSLAEEASDDPDAGPGIGGGANFYRLFLSIRDLEMPSIAAINGHAIGAGLCFSLGADIRIIHERAKVGMTFTKLGIHPGMAATWNLPRLIGDSRAAELLFTGRVIGAEDAVAWGIASRSAGDDFDEVVDTLAREIAAAAPLAVRSTKKTLRGTHHRTIDEAVEMEGSSQAETFKTADAKEGIQAITERRDPEFAGR